MNKKRMACKVQNVECLWKRVIRLGNCQATVSQTGNHQSAGSCSHTDTVTCLGNCWLNSYTELPVWVTLRELPKWVMFLTDQICTNKDAYLGMA